LELSVQDMLDGRAFARPGGMGEGLMLAGAGALLSKPTWPLPRG
jgi:hypothetical protein